MPKLRSAVTLLASGSFRHFGRRFRTNLRQLRLRRAKGHPITYRLAGFPFVCMPDLRDSVEAFLGADVDQLELSLMRAWLTSGDAVIDVGSNLGVYTFCAHHHLRGRGAFLAIDASPVLTRSLELSAHHTRASNIVVEQAAIGDRTGTVDFLIAPPGDHTVEQSLFPDPDRAAACVPLRIPMETLTGAAERHPAVAQPAVVKLDIEGAEPLALRGAPVAWFTASGPLWMVEINPGSLARAGYSSAAITDRFTSDSFELWLVPRFGTSGERLLPLRRFTRGETFADARFYNLIAIPCAATCADRRQRLAQHLPRGYRS